MSFDQVEVKYIKFYRFDDYTNDVLYESEWKLYKSIVHTRSSERIFNPMRNTSCKVILGKKLHKFNSQNYWIVSRNYSKTDAILWVTSSYLYYLLSIVISIMFIKIL